MKNDADLQQVALELQTLYLPLETTRINYDQLKQHLVNYINQLLKNDFAALVQILYQMDIPEEKLRYFLQQNQHEMASGIIASLMIERQLQKVESRKKYNQKHDISDDEKW